MTKNHLYLPPDNPGGFLFQKEGEEKMVVQEYVLHLANGDNIVASEPYELEGPKTIHQLCFLFWQP